MRIKLYEKKKLQILLLLLLTLILGGCSQKEKGVVLVEKESSIEELSQEEKEVEVIPEFVEIQISGVGDIMIHGPQIRAQYDSNTKGYDFGNNFKYVEPYLQEADLMLGNLETTFAGEEKGYSSYPNFNTPDSLANALKKAGFDALSTANNHSFDTGKAGIIRTLEVLKQESIESFGTKSNLAEKSYSLVEVKGITVGLSSYTYETPRWGEYRTINAIKIPKDAEGLIDTFGYEELEEDLEIIHERVKEMRQQGAEIVVFYMHWGNEYKREPNNYQIKIAQALSNYGVDIIFGSHPHVIQTMDILESEVDQKKTVVIYSMGNFLSNQRYEILKNRYTEDGIIVNVKMKKNLLTNEITLKEITYVPTWVHRYFENGKAVYEILPTYDVVENSGKYDITSENTLWRVTNSHNNTLNIIESEAGIKDRDVFKGLSYRVENK